MRRHAFIVLALALSGGGAGAAAQQPGAGAAAARRPPRTVTVSATASVQRQPDQAAVSLAVETHAATAKAAVQQNAERMNALMATLRKQGLAEKDIRTVGYDLSPEYEQRTGPQTTPPRIVGYRAQNTVRVVVSGVEKVGPLLDAVVASGANRVMGIDFQLADPLAARTDALKAAVAQARREAEAVAGAAGQRLGELLDLSTGGAAPPPRPMFAARAEMAAPTPILPGELEVTASVTAVYALEPAG